MKYTLIIGCLLVAIVASFLGFLLTNKNETRIVEEEVPLPEEFIANPAIKHINGKVHGVVAEKYQDRFILKEGEYQVILYLEPRGVTSFSPGSVNERMEYEDVKVGDYLEGGVSIIVSPESAVGLTGSRSVGDIIAHYFTVTSN